MKKYIFSLLSLFSILFVSAQEKAKDTLFFGIDKYYTISPTITYYPPNQTYWGDPKFTKIQMSHTKTNGYIVFIGNGIKVKNLRPKKILSIKDYIENRKFYYDGKYNQRVDRNKLKDSLTNKYIIFFVNGDEFIQPRELGYNSYYPLRNNEGEFVDRRIKDTLYFKFNEKYIYPSEFYPKRYSIRENIEEGDYFLTEVRRIKDLRQEKIFDLKEFIQSSNTYNKDKKLLKGLELFYYLNNYVLYLVKTNQNQTEYIEVEIGYEIE